MKNILGNLSFILAIVICGTAANTQVFAQCGADGTQPCPPKTVKAAGATKSAKPTNSPPKSAPKETAAQRAAREAAERERAEQARLARERQKAKQTALKNKAETEKFLNSLRIPKKNSIDSDTEKIKLFPVEQVVLGETGSIYLSLTGPDCGFKDRDDKPISCYNIKGIFVYCDEKGVADSISFSRLRLGGMPAEWKKQGFDWDFSYNEWIKFLEGKGYTAFQDSKPVIVFETQKYLNADLSAYIVNGDNTFRLRLSFKYGYGKTTLDDKGTLFSISVEKV